MKIRYHRRHTQQYNVRIPKYSMIVSSQGILNGETVLIRMGRWRLIHLDGQHEDALRSHWWHSESWERSLFVWLETHRENTEWNLNQNEWMMLSRKKRSLEFEFVESKWWRRHALRLIVIFLPTYLKSIRYVTEIEQFQQYMKAHVAHTYVRVRKR